MSTTARLLYVARCGLGLGAARQVQIHDFLAPPPAAAAAAAASAASAALLPASRRRLISSTSAQKAQVGLSSTASRASGSESESGTPDSAPAAQNKKGKRKPLSQAQRDFLSSALRVNQAGELAATLIYKAQTPVLVRRQPHLRPLMKKMYDQEAAHLDTFNTLLSRHRVRPTAMQPLWSVMSYGLGWTTALMGPEAAMACTEAVETEIGDHYNGQIRTLLEMVRQWEDEGYEVGDEFRHLISSLRRIRDEELDHLDHAVEHDAKKAEPHGLLTGLIRLGCRGAIWMSERV